MNKITSDQNPKFKLWSSLLTSKGIKKSGMCLVSGQKIVPELMKSRASEIESVLISEKISDHELNPSLADRVILLTNPLFAELDIFGTNTELLVMKTPEISQDWDVESAPTGLELLLPLGDPENLGASIRSAVGFGASKIVLLEESTHPFHPKVTRSSSGANFQASFLKGPKINDLAYCKSLVALDMDGEDLSSFQWPKHCQLLIGDEGPGIPSGIRDSAQLLKIPMTKELESFNAAISASVAMYSYRSKYS